MDGKGKLTKEVVAQEARFVLDSVLNSGGYPQEMAFEDLRHQCEQSVSMRLLEYVNFLERFGYMTHDRATNLVNITNDGERVVSGEKMAELVIDVVHHFRPILARTRTSEEPQPSGPARARRPRAPLVARDARIDDRYEKVKALGSGGIGTVYLARQLAFERQVALKEIRELFGFFTEPQRQEIVRRFDEAARAAAALSHPNIVAILDGNTGRDYPYLVAEYLPHGSLRKVLNRAETIPPDLAVKIFLQVLNGLACAHQNQVIHRSIKPENILFDAKGNVRLTDFGMARVVERDQNVIQHVYVGMGSVAYLAPEAFNNPAALDHRSDLYALGITFYETLARRLPGRRSPMPTKLHPTLPKVIDDLFDRLTQDDPLDRYQSVEDALEDFYKSDHSKAFLEPRGTVLFVENPLSKLVLKHDEEEAAEGEELSEPVIDADRSSAGIVRAVSSEAALAPPATEPPLAAIASAVEGATAQIEEADLGGDDEDGDKPRRRQIAHRPYSFQQRIKDREK